MNTPKEIAYNYVAIGAAKTKNSVIKTLILGIMAGMFVALASVGATIVQATVAGTTLASAGRLMSGAVFPAGLVMVLIGGLLQHLYVVHRCTERSMGPGRCG